MSSYKTGKLNEKTTTQLINLTSSRKKVAIGFTFFTCCILLFSAINNFYMNEKDSSYILLALSGIVLVNFIFIYKQWIRWSLSYLFGSISIAIFFFDSYHGVRIGTFLFYFPLVLGIATVFDFRSVSDRNYLIVHLSFVAILLSINLFSNNSLFHYHSISESHANQIFRFNILFSILASSYFVFLVVKSNREKIDLLNNVLEEETKNRLVIVEKNQNTEILLAELQHRLKNNLSLMSSLVKIKMEQSNVTNYAYATKESIHAIQTVAYANHIQRFDENRFVLNLQPFMNEICTTWQQLFDEFPIKGSISCSSDHIEIHVKQGIIAGLLAHECISLFWLTSVEKDLNEKLTIHLVIKEDLIQLTIQSSIPNLLKQNEIKSTLIEALLEQLDGDWIEKDLQKLVCQFPTLLSAPAFDSAKLFKK